MKESAVDCNFNKRDNIMSNRELESLKCNDIIIGEGNVTYDIWIDELDSRSASSVTEAEKIILVALLDLMMMQFRRLGALGSLDVVLACIKSGNVQGRRCS